MLILAPGHAPSGSRVEVAPVVQLRVAAVAAILAAMAAHSGGPASAATSFCDDFAANTAVPGNGGHDCGDLFRSGTGVNNGAVTGATFIRPLLFVKADPDGRFDGNIPGGTSDLGVLSGLPVGTIFLDKSGLFGAHAFGSLTLTKTQTQQSNQQAAGGMWYYDPQDSGYIPSIIGVKAGPMYAFWDVTDARTLVAGIWEGYWSTEGLVKDNGNFSALSHLNVYGVKDEPPASGVAGSTVPLPAALPLFLGGIAALGFAARRRKAA